MVQTCLTVDQCIKNIFLCLNNNLDYKQASCPGGGKVNPKIRKIDPVFSNLIIDNVKIILSPTSTHRKYD